MRPAVALYATSGQLVINFPTRIVICAASLRESKIVWLAFVTVINGLPAALLIGVVLLIYLTQGTVLLPFKDCCT